MAQQVSQSTKKVHNKKHMSTNTNIQAIAFSNQEIRPMANVIYSAYLSAKKIVDNWNGQSISVVIPNDANILGDGAANDGRPIITDSQATTIITRCNELVSWMENGLVASPFGTTSNLAYLNTIVVVANNGQTQF